jgi:hypothetical protein
VNQIWRLWETTRTSLINLILANIATQYGLNTQVLENGKFRDPTLEELAERLRYMSSDDMRASCRGRDLRVCEIPYNQFETDQLHRDIALDLTIMFSIFS